MSAQGSQIARSSVCPLRLYGSAVLPCAPRDKPLVTHQRERGGDLGVGLAPTAKAAHLLAHWQR